MLKNKYGFANGLPLLEEFLSESISIRWGGLTGRHLKDYLKSGARAQADAFTRDPGTKDNRIFLRSALEGCGIHHAVAADIAANSPACTGARRLLHQFGPA